MDSNQEKILQAFAAHLKKLRKEKGFSQEKLAFEAGLDLSHIAKMETCKRNPKLTTLVALSKALQVPVRELTDFEIQ